MKAKPKAQTQSRGKAKPIPRRRGRPVVLTVKTAQAIGSKIGKGMLEEDACLALGVNYRSWVGAKGRRPELSEALKKGRALFQDQALDLIMVGKDGWTGLAWILERRHGAQFRRRGDVQVTQNFAVGFTEGEWKEIVARAQQGPKGAQP